MLLSLLNLSARARVVQTLLVLAAFFAPGAVWAQETEQAEQPESVGEALAADEEALAAVDLSSPRATLRSFLEAMNAVEAGDATRWDDALECIYHADLTAEEWAGQGQELAQELLEVLNAITINFDRIPEESEERDLSVVLDTVGEEEAAEEISLDFRLNDDGQWRVSRSKLEAQVEELQVTVEEAAEEAEPVSLAINPSIANPRQTIRTFLEGFSHWDEGGRDEALLTLDLSGIAENIRDQRGEELAYRLKDIIDRDRLVVYQEIPDTTVGSPYVHLLDPSDSTNRRKIEIVPVEVEGVEDAYEWRFSAATLDALDEMWTEHFFEQDIVTGVVEVEVADRPLTLRLQDYLAENVPFMMKRLFLLDNWQWAGLFLTILLGMAVSRFAAFLLLLIVRRIFRQEHFQLDEKLEKSFVKPVRIAIMAWVWWVAIKPLGLPAEVLSWLKIIVTTLSAVAGVWAVYRLVDILGNYVAERALRSRNRYDDMVVPLIVRTLKIFVLLVGLVFVMEINDAPTTKLLAGMGIGGLAFALAAQDTIGNLFGSLTLLFDRPFQIGDWIQIGDVDGSVESVGMRSTRVRTFYNSVITVPNSELTNATIDNYGQRRYRRFKTEIGVTYDTPPEKIDAFCEGIRELIRQHPYTRKDYFHVYLNSFGDSALNILLYAFHECPDWSTELRERHRLMLDIIRLAERLGVEFAFPTQTLYMQAGAGSPDGTSGPLSASEAPAKGRAEASGIVEEFLGKGAPLPPPVTFETPSTPAQPTGEDPGEA